MLIGRIDGLIKVDTRRTGINFMTNRTAGEVILELFDQLVFLRQIEPYAFTPSEISTTKFKIANDGRLAQDRE